MPRDRIEFNESWFGDIAEQVARDYCLPIAERAAAIAQANAQVDTGAYRASIRAVLVPRSRPGTYLAAEVQATDPKAMLIESRTGNLARALKAAGG